MRKKYWVVFLLFILLIFQLSDIQAQKIEKKYTILWKDPVTHTLSEDRVMSYLSFEGCVYLQADPGMPAMYEMLPMNAFYEEYKVSVSNANYEVLNAKEAQLISEDFHHKTLEISTISAYERKKPYLLLSFVPIIETAPGQYSRLTSVTITVEGTKVARTKSAKGHTTQSVLANGQWYRCSLTQTGMYRVTYNDLISMGMQAPISSAQLAIFGNGGTMLPEIAGAPRPDDLLELPIMMFDNGDGTFDNGDYFVFYGQAPHGWSYDSEYQRFKHATNIYCDSSYYFITNTPGVGIKKRISTVNNNSLQANVTASDYIFYDFIEDDVTNMGESGRDWFGDYFDITTSRQYRFNTPTPTGAQGLVSVAVAGISKSTSRMNVKVNSSTVGSVIISPIGTQNMAITANGSYDFTPSGNSLNVTLDYNKPTTTSSAYLDWIELQIPCQLSMYAAQVPFCNPSTVGGSNVTEFRINGANTGTYVWDVTDPSQSVQFVLQSTGSGASFKVQTDTLRKFIAFDGTDFHTVTPIGSVANQNLHASSNVDLVIVTHPNFRSQADRLANFRSSNDGLNVKVVNTQQVYNEFSSGSQDPMAIRDYMKMIYDRTNGEYPKYLLLFGRPCYDYRGRVENTKCYVPNYQYINNRNSLSEVFFWSCDDMLGLLDDEEGDLNGGLFDIPVGRFPASTVSQATTAVDKSINYTTHTDLVGEQSSTISNLADWRNMMAFVADDEESNDFIVNADTFSAYVKNANPNINFDKIYLDAYPQVSNAGGQRYPDVTTAINNRMNRGALMFTYIGHSGKDGWAAERILESSDINKWTNKYNLPLMLTLSCTFGFYDRPTISPADLVFFNSNGGASALITASREAWSYPNNAFGGYMFRFLFDKEEYGRYPTIGETEIHGKNKYGGATSSLGMFILYGDPSMPLAIPRHTVVTDSVNQHLAGSAQDTLRAFSKVTICGHIADDQGAIQTDFNGTVYPSVFDKSVTVSTLQNDPGSLPFSFEVQKSLLFKGNNTVKNGRFSFSFYVPKDINYNYGNGKISYYAHSMSSDAAGAYSDIIIGGTDTSGLNDKEGPEIELYLNDETFVNGGIVNSTPILIAKIKDNYGINTTGNGIGHDLTAVLDGLSDTQVILNDYYQTEKDSFNMGTVRYQMSEQSVGKHTIMLRAWDINNNHAEKELTFEVVSDEKLTLSHVLNYPNPFTTHTEFFFEHNRGGGLFDIQVQIYTISGKLVKTINTNQYLDGNRSYPIPWDGLDDYGDKIGKGVYMYRLRVRDENMETAEVIEKLVIL
ncbi:MAG: type IX secretion system sortase PorU [Bacteroidales bacterium]|nr:type IX secretion system sortase PorU [Bacteroidales bacterium]